jgi:hypothetical protein
MKRLIQIKLDFWYKRKFEEKHVLVCTLIMYIYLYLPSSDIRPFDVASSAQIFSKFSVNSQSI